MADTFPAPKVALGPNKELDLEQLGNNDLITHVHFPGIDQATGGTIYPNWRGCTASGAAGDNANNQWPIDGSLEPQGLPVRFPNALLKGLDQGWVFYSYSVKLPGEPNVGVESKRLFFYVGKRPSVEADLPVPQIKESHELALDPHKDVLPAEGVIIVAPPYAAMSIGDKVTLLWDGFTAGGAARPPIRPIKEVKEADIGQPLTWTVTKSNVMLIANGRVELSYRILYANNETSDSAQQILRIVAPPVTRLPEPTIKQYSGGPLDPSKFPNGAIVQIKLYPEARAGDSMVLYVHGARSSNNLFLPMRVDPSTIDSGVLEFHLQYDWLAANIGKIELFYQYSRPGEAMSANSLKVDIRNPLDLPVPNISYTTPEGEEGAKEGYMQAVDTTRGTQVRVSANAGAGSTVHLHWGSPGTPGHHVVTAPNPDDWQLFDIPANAIAMNMGASERLKVFYRVVLSGDLPDTYQDSEAFNLRIVTYPETQFPTIQCPLAQGTGGKLSLAQVGTEGAEFRLGRWAYMHKGQILNIKVVGHEEYLFKDHVVTESEADPGKSSISGWLSRNFLANQLGEGGKFKVSVTISFNGTTHTPLRDSQELTLTL
jgi:hypothetical protein